MSSSTSSIPLEAFIPDPDREAQLRELLLSTGTLPEGWDRDQFGMKYNMMRSHFGVYHTRIARYLRITPAAVKQWANSGRHKPATISAHNLVLLAQFFGAPLEWLLFAPLLPAPQFAKELPPEPPGHGPLRVPNLRFVGRGAPDLHVEIPSASPDLHVEIPALPRAANLRPDLAADFVTLPYLSLPLSAGNGAPHTDAPDADADRYVVPLGVLAQARRSAGQCVAVPIQGDSMEPLLLDGDTALVDTGDITPVDGRVFAVRIGQDVYVKRLVRAPTVAPGALRLVSLSPEHPEMVLSGETLASVAILGRVFHRSGPLH